jgi:hypothetical protein
VTYRFRHVLRAWIFILAAATSAWAQGTAQINGIVRDESGGALPGADVDVAQTQTGLKRSTVTDSAGSFVLPNLPIGPYQLNVALQGFRTFTESGIVLQVNSSPVIQVTLSLGNVAENVSVTGAAPLVETRNTTIGTVIDNERIEALPLNGRNPVDLIALAGAAVVTDKANSRAMPQGQAISVAGGQGFGVSYVLDGAMHTNPYNNMNMPLPFPDALQEFRVETSAMSAQTGMHAGAAVSAVTKSGTNQFHGDAFEFFRNHRFNATNAFAAVRPDGKRSDDGLNRNQLGGTLGGPIVHDRLFFFGAHQSTLLRQVPSDNVAFVPSAAMLAGDFTAFASPACNSGRAIALRAPFVNNRIDPAAFSPAALRIAKGLPTSADPCGRLTYSRPGDQDERQSIGRVDYQMSASHSLFGRYMATSIAAPTPYAGSENLLTAQFSGTDNLAQNVAFGDTWVVSSTTVNALRVTMNRENIHRTAAQFFQPKDVGINIYSYVPDYTVLSVTNAFNVGAGTATDATFRTNVYQAADDVTLVRGSHQFGLGANLATWKNDSVANVRSPGTFSFNGQVTGLSMSDFLTGNVNTFIQSAPNVLFMKESYIGLYAQDSWRRSARMSLNYGLRWEPYLPQVMRDSAIFNFSADRFLHNQKSTVFANAPAGFTYPGDPGFLGKSGMKTHWLDLSPRVGLAWDPRGDGRMSVRSSYSLAYDRMAATLHLNTHTAPPWGFQVNISRPAGGLDDPYRGIAGGNPFPAAFGPNALFPQGGSFLALPSDIDITKVHAWNLSFEKQVGVQWAAAATYLGNYTTGLWNLTALNPGVYIPGGPCTLPDGRTYDPCSTTANLNSRRLLSMQNWAQGQYMGYVDAYDSRGTQIYNGLLTSIQRRAANGLGLNANYTLSHCVGSPNAAGVNPNVGNGYIDPNNIDYDRGNCNSDRRHIFNLTLTYQTPRVGPSAVRALTSDWRLSGILRMASGAFLNITTGLDNALTGANSQRPNQVLDDPYGAKSLNNYLNPNAFAQPASGTLGNVRRNSVEGPGTRVFDAALARIFRVGSRQFEARIEAFNAFNWTRWGAPVTTLNSPTFGQILSADDPRIMQFAVKYTF